MDLSTINNAASSYLPTKKMPQLDSKKQYSVTEFKTVSTSYGPSIVITLDAAFTIFLPKRVVKILLDNEKEYEKLRNIAVEGKIKFEYLGEGTKFRFIET